MSRIKKQLEICPPAYMCKGPNRENFVSTGHKCGYCKDNGWFWGTDWLCHVTHAMSVVWKSSMIAETLRFCVLFYALPWVKS